MAVGKGARLHAQSSEFSPTAPHREPTPTSSPLNSMSALTDAGSIMYQNERSNHTK